MVSSCSSYIGRKVVSVSDGPSVEVPEPTQHLYVDELSSRFEIITNRLSGYSDQQMNSHPGRKPTDTAISAVLYFFGLISRPSDAILDTKVKVKDSAVLLYVAL